LYLSMSLDIFARLRGSKEKSPMDKAGHD
jgi:hypothetical protein